MINIEESTIPELQSAMRESELTSRDLVFYYMSRIASADKCENGLNSVMELNPDALSIAAKLDAMRGEGVILSPLHGIPVLLKDNISTKDKMRTSAGSAALHGNIASQDAHIVKLLRDAGAVILGKTNMTEFANYMTDNMPCGYSSRGGRTLNPYNRTADPSGSSTGSAVAVSANLCAAAVGTETAGSIISPSQVNGIVGIKPTMGLISRHGIIPISFTLDTAGPMARSVTDAAILLSVMAGRDEDDPATYKAASGDLTQYLDKDGLNGARIGISRMFTENADKEKLEILENIIPVLSQHGAECTNLPEHPLRAVDNLGNIMKYEFKSGINGYLSLMGNTNAPGSLQDIILYNQRNPKETLRYGQTTLIDAQNNTSGAMTEPAYINSMLAREEIIRGLDKYFDENNIDVIFSLAGTGLPAFTGFPSMTMPVGTTKDGMPLGSFWIARRYDEKNLLRVTYALEQILRARRNPFENRQNKGAAE